MQSSLAAANVKDVLKESITYEDDKHEDKTCESTEHERSASFSHSSNEVCFFFLVIIIK